MTSPYEDPYVPYAETASYADIGEVLRLGRQELQLDIAQVSQMLHIRACYLEALEAGQFNALPGVAYARGYLQTYAAFLQLDREEILRQFDRAEAAMLKHGFYLPQAMRREKRPSPRLVWSGIGAALGLYLLWLLIIYPPSLPSLDFWPVEPSPGAPRNDACFRAQDVLYPPCHMTGAQFELLPLRRQMVTIMDLAP